MNPYHLFKQVIQVHAATGSNDYGETEHSAAVTTKARVEYSNKSKQTDGGEVIPISAIIWVRPDVVIDAGGKITFGDTNYRVVSRKGVPDASGRMRFYELECTEWR